MGAVHAMHWRIVGAASRERQRPGQEGNGVDLSTTMGLAKWRRLTMRSAGRHERPRSRASSAITARGATGMIARVRAPSPTAAKASLRAAHTAAATPGHAPERSASEPLLQDPNAAGVAMTPSGRPVQAEPSIAGNGRWQRKLAVGAINDPLEYEADRIADLVTAAPRNSAVGGMVTPIQRCTGQSANRMPPAPASVDQALASPGAPLNPALRDGRYRVAGGRIALHPTTDPNLGGLRVTRVEDLRSGQPLASARGDFLLTVGGPAALRVSFGRVREAAP